MFIPNFKPIFLFILAASGSGDERPAKGLPRRDAGRGVDCVLHEAVEHEAPAEGLQHIVEDEPGADDKVIEVIQDDRGDRDRLEGVRTAPGAAVEASLEGDRR